MRSDALINVVLVSGGRAPEYKHDGDAGMDCYARVSGTIEPIRIAIDEESGELRAIVHRVLIPLGFCLELPHGLEAQIRGRSGLSLRNGLEPHIGTVDAGYRGEVSVLLYNFSHEPYTFQPGERVAQMIIAPVMQARLKIVEALGESVRGTGGYGSTGK